MARPRLLIFPALLLSILASLTIAAPSGAGSTWNTRVTISQKFPAFHGKVKSGSEFCRNDRRVFVYRVRNGKPDKLIGMSRTGRTGNWKVRVSLITAAYYAYAPRYGSASLGVTCRPARSHLVGAD